MENHEFHSYVQRMCGTREWGSTIDMLASAQVLKCDFIRYTRLEIH